MCFAVLGIAQKNNERKRREARRQRQQQENAEEFTTPETPKRGLDEILAEIKKAMQEEALEQPRKPMVSPMQQTSKPVVPMAKTRKPYVSNSTVIENVETDPRSLETIVSEIDTKPRPKIKTTKKNKPAPVLQQNTKNEIEASNQKDNTQEVDFDLRQAVIYSEILKPKYLVEE